MPLTRPGRSGPVSRPPVAQNLQVAKNRATPNMEVSNKIRVQLRQSPKYRLQYIGGIQGVTGYTRRTLFQRLASSRSIRKLVPPRGVIRTQI